MIIFGSNLFIPITSYYYTPSLSHDKVSLSNTVKNEYVFFLILKMSKHEILYEGLPKIKFDISRETVRYTVYKMPNIN